MHTSVETLDLIIDSSKTKTSMPWRKLLALSILAGIFISVGAVASNTVSSTIENPALARLFSGLVFPAGLAMVVIAGSELFTGNNLMMIGILQKQIPLGGMLRNHPDGSGKMRAWHTPGVCSRHSVQCPGVCGSPYDLPGSPCHR